METREVYSSSSAACHMGASGPARAAVSVVGSGGSPTGENLRENFAASHGDISDMDPEEAV